MITPLRFGSAEEWQSIIYAMSLQLALYLSGSNILFFPVSRRFPESRSDAISSSSRSQRQDPPGRERGGSCRESSHHASDIRNPPGRARPGGENLILIFYLLLNSHVFLFLEWVSRVRPAYFRTGLIPFVRSANPLAKKGAGPVVPLTTRRRRRR
uniref:(northern house mosquito) hypothetical protein n=1 Tax=Culex pipiens TaxID=7175 RepID=A0A8D8BZ35_CULPI